MPDSLDSLNKYADGYAATSLLDKPHLLGRRPTERRRQNITEKAEPTLLGERSVERRRQNITEKAEPAEVSVRPQAATWWQQLDSKNVPTIGDHFDTADLFRGCRKLRNIKLWRGVILFSADFTSLIVSFIIALSVSSLIRDYVSVNAGLSPIPESKVMQFIIFVFPVILILWNATLANCYKVFKPISYEILDYLRLIFISAAATTAVLFVIDGHFSRILFFSFWLTVIFVLPLCRHLTKYFLMNVDCWFTPTAIFGTGKNAKRVSDAIARNKWLGMKVVAFIDTSDSDQINSDDALVPPQSVISSIRDQRFYELKFGNPHFIFAPETQEEYEASQSTFNHINSTYRSVTLSPPFYGLPLGGAEILNIPRCESMFLSLHNSLMRTPNRFIKRLFDLFVSGLLLLLLAPLFVLIGVIIKCDGGPIFYGQSRIGRNKIVFNCYKFRSMAVDADSKLENHLNKNSSARAEWMNTHKLKNDPRITGVGKFIRKYSIDELPQLFNVFINQMSLVGPRPIVKDELERYGEKLPYYCSTNPGITGLWQTSGRSNTSYSQRVDLDVWYARNWSFWLDIVILGKTIPSIVSSEGAY